MLLCILMCCCFLIHELLFQNLVALQTKCNNNRDIFLCLLIVIVIPIIVTVFIMYITLNIIIVNFSPGSVTDGRAGYRALLQAFIPFFGCNN